MEEKKYVSISLINKAIKNVIDAQPFLNKVYLKGEISNFKGHTRGHLYFTLKDESSRISAVMFASAASSLTFTPADGMNVLVEGRISVYEANGGYQIYVDKMDEDGIGNLYLEYEKLKKKLASEGLFDEKYKKNTVVILDKIPKRVGYTFTGWYADKELTDKITSVKMTSDKTVYAGWQATDVPNYLNNENHFAYIVGYEDGTVRPNANISRAEVAAIFFRLLKDDVRDDNLTANSVFTDVAFGKWYNKSISTMAKIGIVKGRTANAFAPNAPITRAEFAAICSRFDRSNVEIKSDFNDISGHWAENEIRRAASLGWIQGYTDGSFKPDQNITRAEAASMINRMLHRLPETVDDLLDGMIQWPDNQPSDWYYINMQEATNSHDFKQKGEINEYWTKPTANPDWDRYR